MLKTIIVSIALIIVFFLAKQIGIAHWLHPQKWVILTFYITLSIITQRLIDIGMSNNQAKFIPFYITSIIFRLILCFVFVGVELYRKIPNTKLFILNFFALYLFYTVFEIFKIIRNLRPNSKTKSES